MKGSPRTWARSSRHVADCGRPLKRENTWRLWLPRLIIAPAGHGARSRTQPTQPRSFISRLRSGHRIVVARISTGESVLIWLEADVTIRKQTQGRRDFCRTFLGGPDGAPVITFDDLVSALNAVVPLDWRTFFRDRLQSVNSH